LEYTLLSQQIMNYLADTVQGHKNSPKW